tara:strand:- start:116 stop:349 length:234 start_codon:yes stop_codon:yes gene_type:complete
MRDREIVEKELKDKIQELEEKLFMAEAVKQSEVILNQGLRDQLEIKDIQIEALTKINKELIEKAGKLREQINQWKRS